MAEGVLTPEIWIAVAEKTGIEALRRTTRDEPDYDKLMRGRIEILKARDGQGDSRRDEDDDDPVYDEALALVSRMEEVSVSKLQREMRLGYNKAAKIVERMEREGVVGPANGVKPRQVLIRPAGEVSAVPNL